MPHYPDDIEYSDKYTDDYYEYRHVILPKDLYKKLPKAKLLSETVFIPISRNGEIWAYNSPEDGYTIKSIAQNHTFSSLEDQKIPTRKQDYHRQGSYRHQIPLHHDSYHA
jgi:hypothetical protein